MGQGHPRTSGCTTPKHGVFPNILTIVFVLLPCPGYTSITILRSATFEDYKPFPQQLRGAAPERPGGQWLGQQQVDRLRQHLVIACHPCGHK